jgi:Protein of unknown function (DUF1549)
MRVLAVPAALVLPALAAAQFPAPAEYDARIKPKDRTHWAFQPVRPPAVPAVKDAAWVRTPIDAFIRAKLEAKDLAPAPPAPPRAILRRVYLHLTGLPPTLAEQESFLRDPSPAALDRLIDDLLARPAYGERFARRWLDLARYAETNGYERDALKPSVWRYRDYVIRSFNTDKPFDRFVLEQVAGDELPGATAEAVIATGFHRLGPWDDEPADPATDRFDQLDDIVSTTSQVFLGLTVACARCHDHKFEPLTMHDYYRLVAVFDPLTRPRDGRTELDVPLTREARSALGRRDRAIAALQPFNNAVPSYRATGDDTIARSCLRLAGGSSRDGWIALRPPPGALQSIFGGFGRNPFAGSVFLHCNRALQCIRHPRPPRRSCPGPLRSHAAGPQTETRPDPRIHAPSQSRG